MVGIIRRLSFPPGQVPEGPLEIDWSHPLAVGLVACYIPGSAHGLTDIVGNGPTLALSSGAKVGVTSAGAGLLSSVASSCAESATSSAALSLQTAGSLFLGGDVTGVLPSFQTIFGLGYNTANTTPFTDYVIAGGGAGTPAYFLFNGSGVFGGLTPTGAAPTNGRHGIAVSFTVSGTITLYLDGVSYASGNWTTLAAAGAPSYAGPPAVCLGGDTANPSHVANFNSQIALIYNRSLSDSEQAVLSANPFQFLRSPVRVPRYSPLLLTTTFSQQPDPQRLIRPLVSGSGPWLPRTIVNPAPPVGGKFSQQSDPFRRSGWVPFDDGSTAEWFSEVPPAVVFNQQPNPIRRPLLSPPPDAGSNWSPFAPVSGVLRALASAQTASAAQSATLGKIWGGALFSAPIDPLRRTRGPPDGQAWTAVAPAAPIFAFGQQSDPLRSVLPTGQPASAWSPFGGSSRALASAETASAAQSGTLGKIWGGALFGQQPDPQRPARPAPDGTPWTPPAPAQVRIAFGQQADPVRAVPVLPGSSVPFVAFTGVSRTLASAQTASSAQSATLGKIWGGALFGQQPDPIRLPAPRQPSAQFVPTAPAAPIFAFGAARDPVRTLPTLPAWASFVTFTGVSRALASAQTASSAQSATLGKIWGGAFFALQPDPVRGAPSVAAGSSWSPFGGSSRALASAETASTTQVSAIGRSRALACAQTVVATESAALGANRPIAFSQQPDPFRRPAFYPDATGKSPALPITPHVLSASLTASSSQTATLGAIRALFVAFTASPDPTRLAASNPAYSAQSGLFRVAAPRALAFTASPDPQRVRNLPAAVQSGAGLIAPLGAARALAAAETATCTQTSALGRSRALASAETAACAQAATIGRIWGAALFSAIAEPQRVRSWPLALSGGSFAAAPVRQRPIAASLTVSSGQAAAISGIHVLASAETANATQAAAIGRSRAIIALLAAVSIETATLGKVSPHGPIASAQSVTATQIAKLTGNHVLRSNHLIAATQLAALGQGQPGFVLPTGIGRQLVLPSIGRLLVVPLKEDDMSGTAAAQLQYDPADYSDVDLYSLDWSARTTSPTTGMPDPIMSASAVAVPPLVTVGTASWSSTQVQVQVSGAALSSPETIGIRFTVTLASGRILHWTVDIPFQSL